MVLVEMKVGFIRDWQSCGLRGIVKLKRRVTLESDLESDLEKTKEMEPENGHVYVMLWSSLQDGGDRSYCFLIR